MRLNSGVGERWSGNVPGAEVPEARLASYLESHDETIDDTEGQHDYCYGGSDDDDDDDSRNGDW